MHGNPCLVEAAAITGDDGQTVLDGGGRYDEVGLRKDMADFAAFFDQQAPPEHDVFGNRKNAALEHGPYLVDQPVIEFGAAIGFGYEFNPKPNFRGDDDADIQALQRAIIDEGDNLRLRPGPSQFGQDVRIEEPRHLQNGVPHGHAFTRGLEVDVFIR